MDKYIKTLLINAKKDSSSIANTSSLSKNEFLLHLEKQLMSNRTKIISENKKDLSLAKKNDLDPAFVDRLVINGKTIDSMCEGLRNIHTLNDPIGNIENINVRPNGLKIGKMRVPLGVILIIYESRPNVTIDVAALGVKSGNSVILRGGSEALHSNLFLGKLIQKALQLAKLPPNAVQIVNKTDRSLVADLITAKDYIDVIIPRGGKGLIKNISDNAQIPVIKHLDGNCHIYVDEFASLNRAIDIVENSKTQRYGT